MLLPELATENGGIPMTLAAVLKGTGGGRTGGFIGTSGLNIG